jgi:hypothetical protein
MDDLDKYEKDRSGAPIIERASGKLGQLERMLDYRESRLEEDERSGRRDSFTRSEASALRAAIVALRYHREQVEGLPDLATSLSLLLVALENAEHLDLVAAVAQARAVLERWETAL